MIFNGVILSSMLGFFSNNIMILWVLMELNMMLFFVYLIYNKMSKMKTIIFAFTQSVPSLFILNMILMGYMWKINLSVMLFLLLCVKMGVTPFHNWLLKMSVVFPKIGLILFLSNQKFLPLIMICNLFMFNFNLWVVFGSFLSLMVMSVMYNIFLILIMSSNIQMFMFFFLSMYNYWLCWCFFVLYIIILITLFNSFWFNFKDNFLSMFYKHKMSFLFSMLAMSGFPPLIGFFMKFFFLYVLMKNSLMILMLLFMFIFFIMIFIYLRSFIFLYFSFNKKQFQSMNNILFMFILNSLLFCLL